MILGQDAGHQQKPPGENGIKKDAQTEKGPPGNQIMGGQNRNSILQDDPGPFNLGKARVGQVFQYKPGPGQGHPGDQVMDAFMGDHEGGLPSECHVTDDNPEKSPAKGAQGKTKGKHRGQDKNRPEKKSLVFPIFHPDDGCGIFQRLTAFSE